MPYDLSEYLALLKTALLANNHGVLPDKIIVMEAKVLLKEYDRDDIPDWVEALANANLCNWANAVDEIRTMVEVEEKNDNDNVPN